MDLTVRASYIKLDHEPAKMVIRDNTPALEEEDGGWITFTAENLESEDIDSISQQIFEYHDDVDSFIDTLTTEQKNQVQDWYTEDYENNNERDYSFSEFKEFYDGQFDDVKEFANDWNSDIYMSEELGHFIKTIGLEKIKRIFDIKMIIHNRSEENEQAS